MKNLRMGGAQREKRRKNPQTPPRAEALEADSRPKSPAAIQKIYGFDMRKRAEQVKSHLRRTAWRG